MKITAKTDVGTVRKQNQDVFIAEEWRDLNAVFLLVCDGMGGAKAGNVASKMAADHFKKALRTQLNEFVNIRKASEAMYDAAVYTNSVLFAKAQTDPACNGMGTTLVSALVMQEGAVVINIGDSRAYKISHDGISQVTRDHSVVEDMISRGEITRVEAWNHPSKNLITNAIGTAPNSEPDIFVLELSEGDCLLLCSDGLSNLVGDQEFLYEILRGPDVKTCCERLLQLSIVRGAPDNVTAVLLQR